MDCNKCKIENYKTEEKHRNNRLIVLQEKRRKQMKEIDSREVFQEVIVDVKFSTFFLYNRRNRKVSYIFSFSYSYESNA